MGIWAEIKHALNSTLGTEDFEPLDKLYYKGKSLVASDNLYYTVGVLSGGTIVSNATVIHPKHITIKNNGSIRIKCSVRNTENDHRFPSTFYVLANGIVRYQISFGSDTTQQLNFTIDVYSEEILTFKLVTNPSQNFRGSTVSNIEIYADVVDTSLIDVEVIQ